MVLNYSDLRVVKVGSAIYMYYMHDSKLSAKDFTVLSTFEILLHIDQKFILELLQMFLKILNFLDNLPRKVSNYLLI